MKDLEMIKAFAELEGVECYIASFNVYAKTHWECDNPDLRFRGGNYLLYNPITDLALNCAARDKYKTTIFYYPKGLVAACYRDISVKVEKKFASKAVIECILKSQGLWK